MSERCCDSCPWTSASARGLGVHRASCRRYKAAQSSLPTFPPPLPPSTSARPLSLLAARTRAEMRASAHDARTDALGRMMDMEDPPMDMDDDDRPVLSTPAEKKALRPVAFD